HGEVPILLLGHQINAVWTLPLTIPGQFVDQHAVFGAPSVAGFSVALIPPAEILAIEEWFETFAGIVPADLVFQVLGFAAALGQTKRPANAAQYVLLISECDLGRIAAI